MNRILGAVLLTALAFGGLSWAQSRVTADQGTPGVEGPWPVILNGSQNPADGGANSAPPYQCNANSPNKLTVVDGGGTITVPATAQNFRVSTLVCNSPLNTAGTVVTCRADGTTPGAVALAGVGDVLQLGDCMTYTVPSSRNILCTANTVAASVNSYECF